MLINFSTSLHSHIATNTLKTQLYIIRAFTTKSFKNKVHNPKISKPLLLLSVALIGCSCAHNSPKTPQVDEVFTTHIDANDTKKFSYQLTLEKPNKQSRGRQGEGRPEGGQGGKGGGRGDRPEKGRNQSDNGGKQNQKIIQLLDENLTTILTKTGYCRDGYNVIDQEIRQHAAIVNGECIDKANSYDKKLFPNTQAAAIVIIEEDLGNL